jgi:hypothetical protein
MIHNHKGQARGTISEKQGIIPEMNKNESNFHKEYSGRTLLDILQFIIVHPYLTLTVEGKIFRIKR